MASTNPLKDMLHANCERLLEKLAFDVNIDIEVKSSLYDKLNLILDEINGAVRIDGTNFQGFRERTIELNTEIDNLK
jgi:hypothetical protein